MLDVGCGGQVLALLAAERPDLRLHGVDLSWGQVARTRARLGARARIVAGSDLRARLRARAAARATKSAY